MKQSIICIIIAAMLLLYACGNSQQHTNDISQPADIATANAQALFSSKCGICHEFKKDKIGPALEGSLSRWHNDTVLLKQFIKNSKEVIGSGNEYAVALFQKWHQAEMPSFPDMSDEELNALIEYLK